MSQLFPDCVIPACVNPVVEVGVPCSECVQAFGPMLQPGGERLTEQQIADRDTYVSQAYAAQRQHTTGLDLDGRTWERSPQAVSTHA